MNYQDLLRFDPVDGGLLLGRLIIHKYAMSETISTAVTASVQALGVASISFLGMGGADYRKGVIRVPEDERGV